MSIIITLVFTALRECKTSSSDSLSLEEAAKPILKKIGETSSEELTFKKMMQHGMNGAPMGSMNLSHPDYVELKKYIEENF